MSGLAPWPMRMHVASWFGLWLAAIWSILRIHDTTIAGEHSICGTWGCGPTVPALLSFHGFWLLVLIPGSLLAGRLLAARRARALGWAALGFGLVGLAVVTLGVLMDRIAAGRPGARDHTVERVLFAIATTVDLPMIPLALAGLILLRLGRRPSRADPTEEDADGCPDEACKSRPIGGIDHPLGRVEVGSPLSTLTLMGHGEKGLVVPADLLGRPSVLYFMRAAHCSICRRHVRALVGLRDRLGDRMPEVVVVHPGDDRTSKALAEAFAAPFRFASGRECGAHDALGILSRSFGLLQGNGTILVDSGGLVRYARLGMLPFDAFSERELRGELRLLDAGPDAPAFA